MRLSNGCTLHRPSSGQRRGQAQAEGSDEGMGGVTQVRIACLGTVGGRCLARVHPRSE